MRIAILGYSGSGKSTLAKRMGQKYGAPVMHLDRVQFLPAWQIREEEGKKAMVKGFMDAFDCWVIDGNYSKLYYDRRLAEADQIILLLFNRFSCFFRAYSRYRKYKNTTRDDMAEGCNEKFDWAFMKWILWEGRSKQARKRYRDIRAQYGEKTVVIKNQRQLDRFAEENA